MQSSKETPTVLVSDDDINVRLLTRQCLEAEGMRVIEASSGEETIELFIREQPSLIFLDVDMPGMSGLEACKQIRAMPQGIATPIMIVTGSDDRQSIDEGFRAGATQYKTKPVNWSLLGRDVQYMLRASEALAALKQQEDRLLYLVYNDPLTRLPNRRSFTEHLEQLIKTANIKTEQLAVLFIDLDHFKRINDSIGHKYGDQLLVEISNRLKECLENELLADSIDGEARLARMGGDEFTVVLSNTSIEKVNKVAQQILDALEQPIPVQNHNLVIMPSIGISLYPEHGSDTDTLVRNADTAMYAAKSAGRGCFRFYQQSMNAMALDQLKMEEDLRHAIASNQLVLHYQPQVDVRSGKITSLEALVRWQHPELGMISPNTFIPLAEFTGLIIELGQWVLEEVAKQCVAWNDMGLSDFRICVNISPIQFNQGNLTQWIADLLEHTGIDAKRLELELTESTIMTDAEASIERLQDLKDLGLALAVDDFGTGYSSLSYLKQFPIDTLKIDRSFVSDLATTDGSAIVDAILALARSLKLMVVAEGVETQDQMNYLLDRDCDLLQGFYLSRPTEARNIPTIISSTFPANN